MDHSEIRKIPAVSKKKVRRAIRHTIMILPLVGVLIANFLTLSIRAHQFLILITLVWIQVFFLFEVFAGK